MIQKVKVSFEFDIEVPESSTPENYLWYLQNGTWCVENLPEMLEDHFKRHGSQEGICGGDVIHDSIEWVSLP